jgi:hypothetical protein
MPGAQESDEAMSHEAYQVPKHSSFNQIEPMNQFFNSTFNSPNSPNSPNSQVLQAVRNLILLS